MNKRLAILAAPLMMLAASAVTAENQWGFTPYVGADAQWRHMNFNGGLGDNLFRHEYPQGNLFAGIKLNDYLGIEVGYESTAKKNRTVYLNGGDVTAGTIVNANTGVQYTTTAQIKGPHANLVGSFPISEEYRLKIFGMVGVAHLKANLKRTATTVVATLPPPFGVTIFPPSLAFPNGVTSTFNKRKSVLRLAGGLEHMFCNNWGVRATVTWENTHKLNTLGNIQPASGVSQIKENNSIAYGLGVFVTF